MSFFQELKIISDLLTAKYGKIYADACRNESVNTISDKLKHKMSVQSPPKILVERYLIEIAKNYNVEYTPDEQVMREEEGIVMSFYLISLFYHYYPFQRAFTCRSRFCQVYNNASFSRTRYFLLDFQIYLLYFFYRR